MTAFKSEDSKFEAVLASLQGNFIVTTKTTFKNNFASMALSKIFNLQNLSRHDKLEMQAFKITELRVLTNNRNIKDYTKMMAPHATFLE